MTDEETVYLKWLTAQRDAFRAALLDIAHSYPKTDEGAVLAQIASDALDENP